MTSTSTKRLCTGCFPGLSYTPTLRFFPTEPKDWVILEHVKPDRTRGNSGAVWILALRREGPKALASKNFS
jgi:hypothetical protein